LLLAGSDENGDDRVAPTQDAEDEDRLLAAVFPVRSVKWNDRIAPPV
jgi:hypothetical protein